MQAEDIYRKYFKDLAMDFYEQKDQAFRQKFKSIVMNYIKGCIYMGVHVAEITKDVGTVCELAFYGAGGTWEELT